MRLGVLPFSSLVHKSTIYVTVCKNLYTGIGDTLNFSVVKAAKGTRWGEGEKRKTLCADLIDLKHTNCNILKLLFVPETVTRIFFQLALQTEFTDNYICLCPY